MRLAIAFGVIACLGLASVVQARVVLHHGQYQRIVNGSVKVVYKSTLAIRPKRRHVSCMYTPVAGKSFEEIRFKKSECLRRGTHMMCSRETPQANKVHRRWSGVMCWGDLYNKPKL